MIVFRYLIIQRGTDVMGQISPQAGVVLLHLMYHAVQRMVGDEIVARPPSGIVGRIEHICRHLPPSERIL